MKKSISIFLIIILHLTFLIPSLSRDLSFASEYILAPNDQLEIKVINHEDFDTKQAIAPDGPISLPLKS